MPVSVALMADRLVRAEMTEARIKRPAAESAVAGRVGIAPGTLENLRRGRLKNVDRIGPRIRGAFVAFLGQQLAALETELVAAREIKRDVDFGTAEAAIAQAREALGK